MTLTTSDILIGIILFSCVPLQYFLVQQWGFNESSRAYSLNRFVNHLVKFKDEFLTFESWRKWIFKLLQTYIFTTLVSNYDDEDLHGESPAIEVMKFKQNEGYFALSPEPRTDRSPAVKFRVGQVILHKNWKYRGVIVGWDEKAKAPEDWFDEMHGKENKEWRDMPNYSILVDVRDRLIPQITYVPQKNIEVVKNTRVVHPSLDDYFENFDGAQYIPRPWLKALYPQD